MAGALAVALEEVLAEGWACAVCGRAARPRHSRWAQSAVPRSVAGAVAKERGRSMRRRGQHIGAKRAARGHEKCGAVLTTKLAKELGADAYAADAMGSVRIAGELLGDGQ